MLVEICFQVTKVLNLYDLNKSIIYNLSNILYVRFIVFQKINSFSKL